MTQHTPISSGLVGLLLAVAIPAGVTFAQQPVPISPQGAVTAPIPEVAAPATPGAAAGGSVSAQGHILPPGAAQAAPELALTFLPVATSACFQLHNGPGVTWNIRVLINPNTYPYPVTGGTISGTICGSPWNVTGGSVGPSLNITGVKSPAVPGCATSVGIVGNFGAPSGYNGTYGFFGQTTGFSHHTLFLGFDRPTCP